jgi:hypothetical protein
VKRGNMHQLADQSSRDVMIQPFKEPAFNEIIFLSQCSSRDTVGGKIKSRHDQILLLLSIGSSPFSLLYKIISDRQIIINIYYL